MKLIIKTKKQTKDKATENSYIVRIPNYYDTSNLDRILADVKFELPNNENIVEHLLYGDDCLTLDERKQLDQFGEIVTHPKELMVTL